MTIKNFDKYIKAAEIHKDVRLFLKNNNIIRPGIKLYDLATIIENKTVELGGKTAFPTGLSINNICAHYTPEYDSLNILLSDDIMKIDFGVHIDGCIIDSAFTYANNPGFKPLIEATKHATYEAIKASGVDARLNEIGKIIEETIKSYEITINNKTIPINPIYNLGGHNIKEYMIHGNKTIPYYYDLKNKDKMCEDEVFAIETFATTGSCYAQEDKRNISHYAKTDHKENLIYSKSKKLLSEINQTYKTLPFSTRQLLINNSNYGLNELLNKNIIKGYPPLYDIPGSYSSQLEHTIVLTDGKKYVLSLGDDY